MKRSKILVCLTRSPYPVADGTRIKLFFNVLSGLKADFDIEIAIIGNEKVSEDQINVLKNTFGTVHIFNFSHTAFLLQSIIGVFRLQPFQVGSFYNKKVQEWINSRTDDYDAFYVHTIRLSKYFENTPKNKVVVDYNDAISLNYKKSIPFINFFYKIFFSVEYFLVKKFENRTLKKFKNLVIISERDKINILNNCGFDVRDINFLVVPYGPVLPGNSVDLESDGNSIFFVGNLGYLPNKDAVIFFIKNILPKLVEKNKEIKFIVIGKGGDFTEFKNNKNVFFAGFVEDLLDVVKNSSIMVAPVRFGAGVPTKILDAMSLGFPIITTPVAVEGIGGVSKKDGVFAISETDTSLWVSTIESILNDKEYRKGLGISSRKFVEVNSSNSLIQRQWRDVFNRLLSFHNPKQK